MELKRILKLWYFRIKLYPEKVSIGAGCNIALHSTFEGCNVIGRNSVFNGKLGFGSYIAENSNVSGRIGKYCSIGAGVRVLSGTHPLTGFVSTSPVFYSLLRQSNITFVKEQYFDEFLYADPIEKHEIIVGNDVWIGTGATIIGGLTIGDGAVVLANATVTKDIPPYAIAGGVPAKINGSRFDDETVSFLLQFKWWDKPVAWLEKNALFFHDVKGFILEFKKQQAGL